MSVRARIIFATIVVFVTTCAIVATTSKDLFAARYIYAEIRVDGKVLLKGRAGDDGSRDSDEVWRALSKVQFRLTEDGAEWAARSSSEKRLLEGQIRVYIALGGMTEIPSLYVERVLNKDGKYDWMINARDVNQMFERRYISRGSARSLKDVNATK